jgi:hypothetical protein
MDQQHHPQQAQNRFCFAPQSHEILPIKTALL